tara:strand:- start:47 stop:232 length:186 start_codon:yes stop_codon:yes gene_type:complete
MGLTKIISGIMPSEYLRKIAFWAIRNFLNKNEYGENKNTFDDLGCTGVELQGKPKANEAKN